ncbi:Hsp20/alpha crystallin family protein [Sphingobacteriales bacterium CHB3]|nr:Hsp20/alpha crystallin family protein [Sphingobacteriales bacterium CHB3]
MLVQVRRYPTINPLLSEIADFERQVAKVFDSFLSGEAQVSRSYAPPMDIVENDNETFVVTALSGMSKDDVKISVENDILTISGTRKENQLPEKARWVRNEIRTGQFTRSIRLPKGTDSGKISAEMNDGLLKIVLPKAEEVKPREIRVQ